MGYSLYLPCLDLSISHSISSKAHALHDCCGAILFNLGNTTILGWSFAQQDPISLSEWITSWHHIVGLAVFGLGMFINHQSDAILLSLRKTGESHYSIPYGGFFRYVSSPNLLGEIMEWIGSVSYTHLTLPTK